MLLQWWFMRSKPPPTTNTTIPIKALYGVEEAIFDWNKLAKDCQISVCQKITPKRRKQVADRLQDFGEEGWRQVLLAVRSSKWHRGENERGWSADIDYVSRESGFLKLLERKAAVGAGGGEMSDASWRIVMARHRDTGEWSADGCAPDDRGKCRVPEHILKEFGWSRADDPVRLVSGR